MIGEHPDTDAEVLRHADDAEPFSGLVFKSRPTPTWASSPTCASTRARSSPGHGAQHHDRQERERVGRLLRMHANQREEIEAVQAGDIAAIVGPEGLRHRRHPVRPGSPGAAREDRVPGTRHRVSLEPQTKADQDKLATPSAGWLEEDPTFRVQGERGDRPDPHLRDGRAPPGRARGPHPREFKVAANVGKPQVAYREAIRRPAEGIGRFIRQTGGRGQYGHALLRLEPRERGRRITSSSTASWAAPSPGVHPGRSRPTTVSLGHRSYGLPLRSTCAPFSTSVVSRRRLQRDGLPDRCLDGGSRTSFERADPALLEPVYARRGRDAGGVHG